MAGGFEMEEQNIFLLRADQYQQDPGKWFVDPQVDISGLDNGDHPIRLIGSRGSGKTMILRSIAAKPIGESITECSTSTPSRLRIYIRPDNQLMGGMTGWGLEKDVWKTASNELMLLRIFEEATKKINDWLKTRDLISLCFDYDNFCFSENGKELSLWIRQAQHKLYKWARCPSDKPPVVMAALGSLASLLKSLNHHYPGFPQHLAVSVYFDEQEIYREHQQIIINDWIKNPPEGWVFHVAHRRYLDYVTKTSTTEIIDKSNDFREIDLDAPLVDSSEDAKFYRRRFYRKLILNEIRNIEGNEIEDDTFSPNDFLPSYTKAELATKLREEKYANDAWKRLTENAAKIAKKDPNEVVIEGNAIKDDRRWVLWPMMVARRKNDNFDKNQIENLIHNYLTGAILQIYFEAKGRVSMHYYAGFNALCSIVLSNVREFILILKLAIEYEIQGEEGKSLLDVIRSGLSSENQYKAVMARSKQFNKVVAISAAERGHAIEQALNNWFLFFTTVQRLPTLPYNEPNHITCTDSVDKQNQAWATIEAGEKHGAFIFSLPSKQRTSTKANQLDIRLHPLLAAKHCLAYAKRNTMSLSFENIVTITTTADPKVINSIASTTNGKQKNTKYQLTLFGGEQS